MAPPERTSTASGPDRLVTYGVSHVAARPRGCPAHTMAQCGLGELRSVPDPALARAT
jgi:hypothetical protein